MLQAILQFIADYWAVILGLITITVAGYYVPVIRGALIKIWAAFMTEKVIVKVLMDLLGIMVKSTKNTLDDKWYNDLAEALGVHQKTDTKEAAGK